MIVPYIFYYVLYLSISLVVGVANQAVTLGANQAVTLGATVQTVHPVYL